MRHLSYVLIVMILTLWAGDAQDPHYMEFTNVKEAVDRGLTGAALLYALGWQG